MEQRTGDVKVDTAGVMTTRHLSLLWWCHYQYHTLHPINHLVDTTTLLHSNTHTYSWDRCVSKNRLKISQVVFQNTSILILSRVEPLLHTITVLILDSSNHWLNVIIFKIGSCDFDSKHAILDVPQFAIYNLVTLNVNRTSLNNEP